MTARRIAGLVFASLLAGCGGSGGASPSVPGAPAQQRPGTAQIRITIPNSGSAAAPSHRGRQFVGADVAGANIGVAPQGSTAIVSTAFDLSTGSTLCTTSGGVRTCTLSITAPIGNDDFYVQTFDAAPVGGTIPSSAHLLGQASIANVAVAGSGTPAPISITVLGQINAITAVASGQITFPGDGATHTTTLIVSGYDFGNIPISGTYSNPITVTLAETGGSGHTQLLLNGSPSGLSATLTSSSDTLGISYDGGGTTGYYATASLKATGATTDTFNVVPMYVSSTSPYYSAANGLQFTAAGQTAQFTISEAAGNLSYTVATSTSGGCGSAATAGPVTGSGSSARVAVTSGTSAATSCFLSITDAVGGVTNLQYATTISNSGVTIGGVAEYALTTSNAHPEPIIAGPDGNMWVGDTSATEMDRFSTSGVQTSFPTAPHPVNAMTSGPDGNLWYVDNTNVVERFTLAGSSTQMYTAAPGTSFGLITVGPDGNIWAVDTSGSVVDVLDLSGHLVTSYTLSGQLNGIATGSDGAVYLTDSTSNQLWKLVPGVNPTCFAVPVADVAPWGITAASDGNLYFTNNTSNTIEAYSPSSGFLHTYTTTAGDQLRGITAGPDGNVWFAAPGNNDIGKLNVTTGAITPYAIPTAGAFPINVTAGPDGRVWFAEYSQNKIGAITP